MVAFFGRVPFPSFFTSALASGGRLIILIDLSLNSVAAFVPYPYK